MPLELPSQLPPLGKQIDPDKVRVVAAVGGQLGTAPARGFGLTEAELTALQGVDAAIAGLAIWNRVVNPCMQISQQWGDVATTLSGQYIADQWPTGYTAAGGVISHQRVQVVTPNGSVNRLRATVTTAKASLAAGDYAYFYQMIEGVNVADFQWGTAQAKQAIIRFGWKSPAGTYNLVLHNGAYDRAYLVDFTISAEQAGIDTEQTFIVPGDTAGTWLKNTGIGLYLEIYYASGTAYTGDAGSWLASGAYHTASITNGLGTLGNVFELFDVGLYLDSEAMGQAPPWSMPDYGDELARCQRYFQQLNPILNTSGFSSASANNHYTFSLLCSMRIVPSITYSNITYANSSSVTTWFPDANLISYYNNTLATGQAYAYFTATMNARF